MNSSLYLINPVYYFILKYYFPSKNIYTLTDIGGWKYNHETEYFKENVVSDWCKAPSW
jgi:hypothetical protein